MASPRCARTIGADGAQTVGCEGHRRRGGARAAVPEGPTRAGTDRARRDSISSSRVVLEVDVASRAELSAKLFHDHIAPSLDDQRIREFTATGLGG
jgi:hypothetical protein